ncbi:transmembrane protein 255B [Electrophorus electricus]|uniref:transmembrane protein 255B n=1 Tax=Electrophorus electricus TaxID=8005 RepID=UPI0015D01CDA|nr:transmembrane protein 255B [Electrophorus electricus]
MTHTKNLLTKTCIKLHVGHHGISAAAACVFSLSLPTVQYAQRRRTALWSTVALLGLSAVVLVIGLLSDTRTATVHVSGYYPGIILSFGGFLGIVGLNIVENRKPLLVASIIFISLGVIACFLCAIVDGIIAAEFIDQRPLMEGRCKFYTSGTGYLYDNYQTEVMCQSYSQDCKMKVRSNSCYCCDLYTCDSSDYRPPYYAFTGVNSCWDVVHLYRLLWSNVVLNVLGVFLGIFTTAILGAFKDLAPATQSQTSPSPAPPPHILYNPTQHMITYTGLCPSGQALPAYPNYPMPLQHLSSYAGPTAPQSSHEAAGSSPPPDEGQLPVQGSANPTLPSQPASQEPGGYMLTPNAPTLYGQALGTFEKPPPYAC